MVFFNNQSLVWSTAWDANIYSKIKSRVYIGIKFFDEHLPTFAKNWKANKFYKGSNLTVKLSIFSKMWLLFFTFERIFSSKKEIMLLIRNG